MRSLTRARRALAAIAVLAAACGRGDAPASDAGADAGPRPAPPLRIAQAAGPVFDLAAERGRVVLVFFGYTPCPDVCPTTLADFSAVRRNLGPRAERVRFVFVTVDPARDTPALTAQYARGFDRSFVGLSTDSASLAPILRGFGVGAWREPGGTDSTYTVAHTASVFVVDPAGRVREPVRWGAARADDLLRAVERALE